MKYAILLSLIGLIGCAAEKGVINPQIVSPVLPMSGTPGSPSQGAPGTAPAIEQGQAIPRAAALSGRVQTSEEMPRPLAGVRVGLFKKQGEQWLQVHEFSTDRDGTFAITRPIERGAYQLRSTDPRYQGVIPLSLDERPLQGILLEVSPVRK